MITTRRLVLRGPEDADLEPLTAYYADAIAMRFVGDGLIHDRDHARRVLDGFDAEWQRLGHGRWTVVLRETGDVLGYCGFLRWREGKPDSSPELAYGFLRESWGQGYATEAGEAALAWAWETLHPSRVVALTHPANGASQRVLTKLGFIADGHVSLPRGGMAFFALRAQGGT
jgi:RimJ/RimL family protein N-acetyltransferase